MSYGVYLWQVPLILFARSNHLLPSGFLPALAAVLPAVLAVSAASWYLVERPLMARAERRRDRRSRRADRPRADRARAALPPAARVLRAGAATPPQPKLEVQAAS